MLYLHTRLRAAGFQFIIRQTCGVGLVGTANPCQSERTAVCIWGNSARRKSLLYPMLLLETARHATSAPHHRAADVPALPGRTPRFNTRAESGEKREACCHNARVRVPDEQLAFTGRRVRREYNRNLSPGYGD